MKSRRNVVVVGGAGGIGAACCTALASDWNPIVVDRDLAAAERVAIETGGRAYQLDVSRSTRASTPSSAIVAPSTGSCSQPA
jgi:NAD(P)-dependent dehydrogenase (short-subunit alcohol dehydrogenase family)